MIALASTSTSPSALSAVTIAISIPTPGWKGCSSAYTAALSPGNPDARRAAAAGPRPARSSLAAARRPSCPQICWRRFWLPAARLRSAPDAEITSEANPGTVDQERFPALRGDGRQPAQHGRAELRRCRAALAGPHPQRRARPRRPSPRPRRGRFRQHQPGLHVRPARPGAATPGRARWRRAIDLRPEHLSLYSLIVEPGTPLADQVRRGQIPRPTTTSPPTCTRPRAHLGRRRIRAI